MRKILLVLSLVFITTGCSANYTLEYKDGVFKENIHLRGEDDTNPTFDEIKKDGLTADVDDTEKFTLDNDSTKYDVKLSHILKNTNLNRLRVVSQCFTLNTYKETEKSYYMSLYGDFTCTNLTNSTFTLETDAIVILNNAHKVKDNKYIWYLEEEKINDEGIKFQILTSDVKKINKKNNTMIPTWVKFLIAIIMISVGYGLIFLLKKANER